MDTIRGCFDETSKIGAAAGPREKLTPNVSAHILVHIAQMVWVSCLAQICQGPFENGKLAESVKTTRFSFLIGLDIILPKAVLTKSYINYPCDQVMK